MLSANLGQGVLACLAAFMKKTGRESSKFKVKGKIKKRTTLLSEIAPCSREQLRCMLLENFLIFQPGLKLKT